MNIITIGREFGSGGRELGRLIAEHMGYKYFDREIISVIAEQSNLDENYVANVLENDSRFIYPLTCGRTFSYSNAASFYATKALVAQQDVIRQLAAKQDCVIVGRNADYILREFAPFNIFVYADMPSKLQRCRQYLDGEEISNKNLEKQIKQVDKTRRTHREMVCGLPWGDKQFYHLCVNTSGADLGKIAVFVAEYAKTVFRSNK